MDSGWKTNYSLEGIIYNFSIFLGLMIFSVILFVLKAIEMKKYNQTEY